jgi:hypothetical protein
VGGRRADYVGGEVDIDGDESRWFNTAAFAVPAEDRTGTAQVGQIEGPSFYQWDLSLRKNFRFNERFNVTPIFDVFNVFNRVNFGNPDVNVSSGGYGTIGSAQPSRQFQFGVRLDF